VRQYIVRAKSHRNDSNALLVIKKQEEKESRVLYDEVIFF